MISHRFCPLGYIVILYTVAHNFQFGLIYLYQKCISLFFPFNMHHNLPFSAPQYLVKLLTFEVICINCLIRITLFRRYDCPLFRSLNYFVQVTVSSSNDLFNSLDASTMKLDEFTLAVYERRMMDIWPQPTSQFYCRICNYSEFASHWLLERHLKSARHLVS